MVVEIEVIANSAKVEVEVEAELGNDDSINLKIFEFNPMSIFSKIFNTKLS